MVTNRQIQQDLQTYNTLVKLWSDENPIKTIKLQFMLETNTILLGFLHICNGVVQENIWLMLGGLLVCRVWILSIGRTPLFQQLWKNKLDAITQKHASDSRFRYSTQTVL